MRFALAMTLPENAAHLPLLRHIVRGALGAASQVGPEDADDIEVMVGELATNSLVHARSTGVIRVEVWLDGDLAVIVVTDTGVGFERARVAAPGTARPATGSDHEDAAGEHGHGKEERWGGWGLLLVERLAERVEFGPNEPHGTCVRAFKRLRG